MNAHGRALAAGKVPLDPAKVDALRALLRHIAATHPPAVFACSFGAEDMLLVDLIAEDELPIGIFCLDTGRLPEETYALIDTTRTRYGLDIELYTPRHDLLEPFLRNNGSNAFYRSPELRKACCALRKIEPLQRALAGKQAWITGQRTTQSITRTQLQEQEFDAQHGLAKFNPLADWSEGEVWAYLHSRDVPYNPLHDRFYPSIGCAPCTRAIAAGEDPRAGRWWWENADTKECGLHLKTAP